MRRPEIALRSGPNAVRGEPARLDELGAQGLLDRRERPVRDARQHGEGGVKHLDALGARHRIRVDDEVGIRREEEREQTGASPSSCMRSCTSGAAAVSRARSESDRMRPPR